MSETVNGLPIGFFVIAGGIIVVMVSWLLMRFGRVIGKAVVVLAGLVIGGVLAVAAVGQAAANFQQSRATVEVAQAAQTATTSNLLLVGAVGCFGGFATLAVLGALALAGVMWYRAQQAERRQAAQLPRQRQVQALPQQFESVVYVDSGDDLAGDELPVMNWGGWV